VDRDQIGIRYDTPTLTAEQAVAAARAVRPGLVALTGSIETRYVLSNDDHRRESDRSGRRRPTGQRVPA
jgi:hypothetical protein